MSFFRKRRVYSTPELVTELCDAAEAVLNFSWSGDRDIDDTVRELAAEDRLRTAIQAVRPRGSLGVSASD